MPSPMSIQEQIASFSESLHVLRQERGWTLDELAERSGLSKSYLSRLESGDRHVSIAAALSLARVFQVSLASLFEPAEAEPCVVVRAGETAAQSAKGLSYWPLSRPSPEFRLQPLRVIVPANRPGDEHQRHDGEEWVYVLSGAVQLSLGGQLHLLGAGDAAHFDARVPHRLNATGGADAEVLLVAVPRSEARAVRPLLLPRLCDSPKLRVQLRQ
jgi:transcriptional regulator with XRE-family HTH domain